MFKKALYKVIVNDEDTHSAKLFLVDQATNLYIDTETLKAWGLSLPKERFVRFGDKNYYNLAGYRGYTYKVNQQNLTIRLNFPAQYFVKNTFAVDEDEYTMPQKSPLGAYLNYELFSTGPIHRDQPGEYVQNSVLLSPTVFSARGNLNTQYLITQGAGIEQETPRRSNPIRLQSFYQLDLPRQMQTIIVGDSITRAGSWGQSVAFGGISWQTNFATQPSYITFPLPVAEGTASVPTSVQLLVDNAVVNAQKVAPGPFAINNVPVVSGAGTLNVVTTNVLGQQVVTSIPYYASPALLKPGLHDFSDQLGFVRENYGINSNNYGPVIGVASDRVGVTDNLTAEADVQAMRDQQNYGGAFAYALSHYLVVNAALISSHNTLGKGGLFQFGFEHQAIRGLSYGGNFIFTSPNYLEMAATPQNLSPSSLTQLFVGATLFNQYSTAASYTDVNNRRGLGRANFLSIKLSRSFSSGISLILSALTSVTGPANRSINLTINMSFGADYDFSLTNNRQGASQGSPAYDQLWASFIKNTPMGLGYGYNLQTTQYLFSSQNQANYQGTYNLNAEYANTFISLAHQDHSTSYQADVTGAVTYIDRQVALSPPVTGAFALAELPDLPDVNVYYNNQLLGQTNANGNIIIPNLQPYTKNNITIDPRKLPINTEIDSSQVEPVPYARQGVVAHFAVQKIQAVVFTLMLPDQTSPPVGAIVRMNEAKPINYVGYNGQVYLPHVRLGQTDLDVTWNQGECHAEINFKGENNANIPLTHLGTVVCMSDRD